MKETERKKIIEYFSSTWLRRDRGLDKYRYSGWALLDRIGREEKVLDVGCGNNPFKGRLDVFGIDPATPNADELVAIEDFGSDTKFDVALCLGSINFGTEEDINLQIGCVSSHLAPAARIFWRCNPGLHDHQNDEFTAIAVFPWTFDHHERFARAHGFSVQCIEWDTGDRIYAEWQRQG